MTNYIQLPDQLTSILDAVNVLIGAIGETPYTSLEDLGSDGLQALSLINNADLALQTRGWSWNREYRVAMARDTSERVPIGDQVLHIASAYSEGRPCRVSQRSGYLYNMAERTTQWDTAPVCDLIVRQSWEDIPQAARRVIALSAARNFLAGQEESVNKLQVNGQDLASALVTLEHQEDESMPQNEVTGNADVQSQLYGSGLSRRNMR